ncbi:MAG: hypothetical protein ACK5YU_12680 [Burkholderiales bacterium]|jgi:hypothetical protein|nr:hypothetical protein [Betaproteobacteria bacterium]
MISTSAQTSAARIEANTESPLDKLLAEVGIKRITNRILLRWATQEGVVYLNSLPINDRV